MMNDLIKICLTKTVCIHGNKDKFLPPSCSKGVLFIDKKKVVSFFICEELRGQNVIHINLGESHFSLIFTDVNDTSFLSVKTELGG
ncbi:hypothetical protein [Photobacterium profundum]|uniref:hypothetical protein n=1 Tax=Photobacterium profundum TaxID=74109 RepID=UPI0012F47F4F|nr:hypothetical protein [Photobacterium profundum]